MSPSPRKIIICGGLLAAAVTMATTASAQTNPAPTSLTVPEDVTAFTETIVARVTQTTLVTIKNSDGIFVNSVGGGEVRPFNSTCAMMSYGVSVVIGERRRDDRYYVFYRPWPVGRDLAEGECGGGTKTYVDKRAFHLYPPSPLSPSLSIRGHPIP